MGNIKVTTAEVKPSKTQDIPKRDGDAKSSISAQLASLQQMRDNDQAYAKDSVKASRDTTAVNEPISAEALHQHLHGKPSGRTY
jgi:hypothetical protein